MSPWLDGLRIAVAARRFGSATSVPPRRPSTDTPSTDASSTHSSTHSFSMTPRANRSSTDLGARYDNIAIMRLVARPARGGSAGSYCPPLNLASAMMLNLCASPMPMAQSVCRPHPAISTNSVTKSGNVAAHSRASIEPIDPPMAIRRWRTPRRSSNKRCSRTLSRTVTGVGKSAAYDSPFRLPGSGVTGEELPYGDAR